MKNIAVTNVRISATGNEYRIPSSPKNSGIIIGKNTPKIISLVIETAVEANALPSA